MEVSSIEATFFLVFFKMFLPCFLQFIATTVYMVLLTISANKNVAVVSCKVLLSVILLHNKKTSQ